MLIAQTSDLHIEITTEKQIKKLLKDMAVDKPDLIINCGDNTGTLVGHKCTKRVAKIFRDTFPDTPILWTNSNHDRWCADSNRRPSMDKYLDNLAKIEQTLKDNNIHYLDNDGVYKHPDHPDLFFVGCSGWYGHPNPPTKDANYLPFGYDGDTHRAILRDTENDLHRNLATIEKFDKAVDTMVFISHFPVINTGDDYKGTFELFSWREAIGTFLIEEYGCKYFLNGHAHQLHTGPLRYECGSDYYKPKYQLINL